MFHLFLSVDFAPFPNSIIILFIGVRGPTGGFVQYFDETKCSNASRGKASVQ